MEKERMLKIREVSKQVGVCRSLIYLWIQRGEFPPPVKLTPKASRWPESCVQKWIALKIENSNRL